KRGDRFLARHRRASDRERTDQYVRIATEQQQSRERYPTLYMRSIIAWPKPEVDTCFAPSIRRAKSYVTTLSPIALSRLDVIRSAASRQPMCTSIISAERISEPGFT